jgi:hypothetical protein
MFVFHAVMPQHIQVEKLTKKLVVAPQTSRGMLRIRHVVARVRVKLCQEVELQLPVMLALLKGRSLESLQIGQLAPVLENYLG